MKIFKVWECFIVIYDKKNINEDFVVVVMIFCKLLSLKYDKCMVKYMYWDLGNIWLMILNIVFLRSIGVRLCICSYI